MAKRATEENFSDDAETLDNYDDILDRSFNEVPMPKDIPLTSYVATCDGAFFVKPKKEGNSPQVLFAFRMNSPVEELDEDEAAELGENYDFSMNRYTRAIWIGEGKDWKTVLEILKTLHVDTEDKTINEALKAAKGKEAVVSLRKGKPYTGADGKEHSNVEVGGVFEIADE